MLSDEKVARALNRQTPLHRVDSPRRRAKIENTPGPRYSFFLFPRGKCAKVKFRRPEKISPLMTSPLEEFM